MKALCQNADMLIHWCYRLSHETEFTFIREMSPCASEIAAMAELAGVKHLLLSHIRKHMDVAEHHKIMLSEAKDMFSGKVEIAEDLQVISV